MTEITNELMYETLKALRGDIAGLGQRLDRIESELRSARHHLAGLVESDLRKETEIAALTLRIERIERRLELVE